MNHRLVITSALFANVAADISLGWSANGASFPSPALVATYALVLGQAGLAAVWLGIGSAPLLLRIVGDFAVLG
ncbi:MAG TPA: hypothetical protein VFI31_30540, partial [Pirellulales bacterium]|nr:hypothetical protein [Pirellulales bacterium]